MTKLDDQNSMRKKLSPNSHKLNELNELNELNKFTSIIIRVNSLQAKRQSRASEN